MLEAKNKLQDQLQACTKLSLEDPQQCTEAYLVAHAGGAEAEALATAVAAPHHLKWKDARKPWAALAKKFKERKDTAAGVLLARLDSQRLAQAEAFEAANLLAVAEGDMSGFDNVTEVEVPKGVAYYCTEEYVLEDDTFADLLAVRQDACKAFVKENGRLPNGIVTREVFKIRPTGRE